MQYVGARLTSWGLSPLSLIALVQMLRKYNNRSSYTSLIWFHSSYCYKLYACSLMHTCVHVSKVYCIYRCANYGIINILYIVYLWLHCNSPIIVEVTPCLNGLSCAFTYNTHTCSAMCVCVWASMRSTSCTFTSPHM